MVLNLVTWGQIGLISSNRTFTYLSRGRLKISQVDLYDAFFKSNGYVFDYYYCEDDFSQLTIFSREVDNFQKITLLLLKKQDIRFPKLSASKSSLSQLNGYSQEIQPSTILNRRKWMCKSLRPHYCLPSNKIGFKRMPINIKIKYLSFEETLSITGHPV